MKATSSDRFLELDVLRGLAAFAVVCFHYTTRYTQHFHPSLPLLFDFQLGQYGVHLFFIISGFVIALTLEKTKHPLDFVVSRFSRLFPAYWTAMLLTFCVVKAASLPLENYHPSGVHLLINMTMLQEWVGIPHIDGSYWTLTIELTFYVAVFTAFIAGKFKHLECFGIMWLIFMITHFLVLTSGKPLPYIAGISMLLTAGHLFFAGILFYNLKTIGNAWHRHVALLLCLGLQYLADPSWPSMGATCGYFAVFYLFVTGRLGWIIQKPLIFLGTISYSLYLIHQYVGFTVMQYLQNQGASAGWLFAGPLLSAVFLASVITFAIERPAMKYIRESYKQFTDGRLL